MRSIHGLPIPTSLVEACDASRTALLIYDMQVDICRQVPRGHAISAACVRLRDRCREAGVLVAYSRHLSLPLSWMGAFQIRMAMAWQRTDDPASLKPWFLRDTPGFEIVPELAPREDEFVFDKLAMSAFEGTPLEFALRDRVSRRSQSAASPWRSGSSRRSVTLRTLVLFRSSLPMHAAPAMLTLVSGRSTNLRFWATRSSRMRRHFRPRLAPSPRQGFGQRQRSPQWPTWGRVAERGPAMSSEAVRVQISVISASVNASSISYPRYRTVFSILVCPSKI